MRSSESFDCLSWPVNIFTVRDGTLSTPDRGVLQGITRRTVFEIAEDFGIPTRVVDIPVGDLYTASKILLTSTAGAIVPVRRLDGDPVGDGRAGEMTTRIRDQYWARQSDHRVHDRGRPPWWRWGSPAPIIGL